MYFLEFTPLIFASIAFVGGLIAVPVGGSFLFIIPAFLFLGLDGFHAVALGRLSMLAIMSASSVYFLHKTSFTPKDTWGLIAGNLTGVLFGTYLASKIHPDVFTKIVPWILLVGACFLLFDYKITNKKIQKRLYYLFPVIGFCTGVYAGLGGGGNGKIIVLLLALALGWGIHKAIMNTRFLELLLNAVACLGYFFFGPAITGYELFVRVKIT